MKKVTVIIPTLLKDINLLNKLLDSFVHDDAVYEIIIINNTNLDYSYLDPKVRVISKKKNLYVNPSWNLGVNEAQTDYIALVNDDIKIPNGLCSALLNQFNDSVGIVGAATDYVIDTLDKDNNILIDITNEPIELSDNIRFVEMDVRTHNFGCFMIFRKENYNIIPKKLKIYYGDDWLLYSANKKGLKNYIFTGQKILHCGSLSSREYSFFDKKERPIFEKEVFNMTLKSLECIFSVKNHQNGKHKVITVLGLNLKFHKKRKVKDLIFSVGEACSCTQTLRDNNLQIKSYPFDWLYGADFEKRIEILVNEFEHFIDKKDLVFAHEEKSIKCNAYYNKLNDITFNHDFLKDLDFENSYEQVIAKYDRRIKRLLKSIKELKSILIVYVETPTIKPKYIDKSDIVKIFNKVLIKYPNKKIELLYLRNIDKDVCIEEKLSSNITYMEFDYKDHSSELNYVVDINKLSRVFQEYKLNVPFNIKVLKTLQRLFISLIPVKKYRKSLRKRCHLD